MNKFKAILITLIFCASLSLVKNVAADSDNDGQYGQYGDYGYPPTQTVLIDKMVGKPYITKGGVTEVEYVDNLSASDPRFGPGQEIYFKIKVKNTANTRLTNVTVKDYVPAYLEPLEGPGSYDASTRIITFEAGDFEADEEKIYYIKMQVLPQDKLPADKGLFCEINKAVAYNDQVSDEDTAQYCIEKQVTGVTTVPSAGPAWALALVGLNMVGGAIGLYLRKKTS